MASKSYPRAGYNSGAVTELEHERLVHAQSPDGLIGSPSDQSLVYADGSGTRAVKIHSGRRGLVRGSQYDSGDIDITVPSLAANGTSSPRLDLIVLRLSRTDYTVTEAAITGTPAASPTAPSPLADTGSTGSFDLPVATVRVEAGATTIAADKVTNVAWYVGSDGQILCTSTTRPPHEAGRVIWETTGKRLISDGTTWIVDYEDTGVVSLSQASGWSTSSGGFIRIQRRSGFATLDWNLQRSGSSLVAGVNTLVCTLTSGYRPTSDKFPTGWAPRGQTRMQISSTDGEVEMLDHPGVTTGEFIAGTVTYPVA